MTFHEPQSLAVEGFMRKSPSRGVMSCSRVPSGIMNGSKGKNKGKTVDELLQSD